MSLAKQEIHPVQVRAEDYKDNNCDKQGFLMNFDALYTDLD